MPFPKVHSHTEAHKAVIGYRVETTLWTTQSQDDHSYRGTIRRWSLRDPRRQGPGRSFRYGPK